MDITDFNPRSREGSDGWLVKTILSFREISIHAPARGATLNKEAENQLQILFQSTLPRGERQEFSAFYYGLAVISIHAPARGAT